MIYIKDLVILHLSERYNNYPVKRDSKELSNILSKKKEGKELANNFFFFELSNIVENKKVLLLKCSSKAFKKGPKSYP